MIVDLMRNDLSRVCRPGTVAVQDLLTIQPHPGVWHLVSAVRGELEAETTVADVLGAAFPPGSVTGAPKIAAQHGIADLEDEPRGAYTGSIGLVSPLAGADFNVIIRSFELSRRPARSSASAVVSRSIASRCGSGTNACIRRHRWSLPPDRPLIMN